MTALSSEIFLPTAEVEWQVKVAGAANSFYVGLVDFGGATFGVEYYPLESILMLAFVPPCCGVEATWEERRDSMRCEKCSATYYLHNESSINSVYSSITFNTVTGKGEEPHQTQISSGERFLHYWGCNPLTAALYASDLVCQMQELALSLPVEPLRYVEPVVWKEWRRRAEEGVLYAP